MSNNFNEYNCWDEWDEVDYGDTWDEYDNYTEWDEDDSPDHSDCYGYGVYLNAGQKTAMMILIFPLMFQASNAFLILPQVIFKLIIIYLHMLFLTSQLML